jgi:hypothetical protein
MEPHVPMLPLCGLSSHTLVQRDHSRGLVTRGWTAAILGGDGSLPAAALMEGLVKIDIDKLTEPELVDLNHRIVARLRFLGQMRAHTEMLAFKIGDRVRFKPEGRHPIEGMLTRYNKKTVTVITDDGQQWNVSPTFLRKAASLADKVIGESNVIALSKR